MLLTWTKTVIWPRKGYSMETTLDYLKSSSMYRISSNRGRNLDYKEKMRPLVNPWKLLWKSSGHLWDFDEQMTLFSERPFLPILQNLARNCPSRCHFVPQKGAHLIWVNTIYTVSGAIIPEDQALSCAYSDTPSIDKSLRTFHFLTTPHPMTTMFFIHSFWFCEKLQNLNALFSITFLILLCHFFFQPSFI